MPLRNVMQAAPTTMVGPEMGCSQRAGVCPSYFQFAAALLDRLRSPRTKQFNIKCATIRSISDRYTRPSSSFLPNAATAFALSAGLKNLAEKPPRPLVSAIGEELRRRPVLHNDAAVGEIDLVGNLAGKAHFVGDDDAGHALLGEFPD